MTRFKEFWAAWPDVPRKVNPRGCEAKWIARKLDEKADQIIQNVTVRAKYDLSWRDGYDPAPMVYINQNRWDQVWKDSRDVRKTPLRPKSHVPDNGPVLPLWTRLGNQVMLSWLRRRRGVDQHSMPELLVTKARVCEDFRVIYEADDGVSHFPEALRSQLDRTLREIVK